MNRLMHQDDEDYYNANVKAVYLSSSENIRALSIEPDYRITNIRQTISILSILQKVKREAKNP